MLYVFAANAGVLSNVVNTQPLMQRASLALTVAFNPPGTRILTASSDKTARVWDVDTGDCLQILEGHTDEIFSCAFNYHGDTIITGSKDNTCRIWKN